MLLDDPSRDDVDTHLVFLLPVVAHAFVALLPRPVDELLAFAAIAESEGALNLRPIVMLSRANKAGVFSAGVGVQTTDTASGSASDGRAPVQ